MRVSLTKSKLQTRARSRSRESTDPRWRIISASNRNLREEVANGRFREDLYYRISVVPVTIPPLRRRVSDIPLLIQHFLKKFQEGEVLIRIDPASGIAAGPGSASPFPTKKAPASTSS